MPARPEGSTAGDDHAAAGGRTRNPGGPVTAAVPDDPAVPPVVPAGRDWRSLHLTGYSGLNALASLGLAVVTARDLGPSGRGVVALIVVIAATTSLVVSLGVNVSARYYLPRKDGGVTLGHYHGLGLVLTVVQGAMALVLVLAFAHHDGYGTALTILLMTGFCVGTMLVWLESDALNAFGHLSASALLNALCSVLQFALVLLVAGLWRLTLDGAMVVLDLGVLAQFLGCLAVLVARRHRVAPAFDRRAWWLMVRKGVPAIGMNAGLSLTFRFDRFVIAAALGSAPLGVYSIAVSGSEALRLFPAAWGQVAFYRVASSEAPLATVRRQRRRILLGMAAALGVWALVTPFLVHALLGPRYDGAIEPWRILLIGEIGIMAYQIDGRILAGLGRTAASGLAGLAGLVLVVPLDLVLIPRHGLVGAAVASAVAYLATGLAAMVALWWTERGRAPDGVRPPPGGVPGGRPA